MKKNILWVALATAFTMGLAACANSSNKTSTEQSTNSEAYQCPMKCEGDKTYAQSGQCPKCNMDLAQMGTMKSEENHEGHQH